MTDVQQQAYDNAKELSAQNSDLTSGCCLMGFNVQSSCGEVTLSDAKVEIDGQVVSNNHVKGSKLQWFPKTKLSITSKYTAKLSRAFNEYGVKFGDLTVVPIDRVKKLQEKLATIYTDWQKDVTVLMGNFESVLEKHCENNPDIAPLIRKHAMSKQAFESRFNLTYLKPLAIQPLFEEDKAELEAQVSGSLWQEIAKDASSLYKTSWFKDKRPVSRVSQGVRNPLKRLSQKMVSLSFIDESVLEVSRTIQDVFDKLPSAGYIEGHAFDQLTNWVHVLSDEDKLRMHASGEAQFEFQTPPTQQAPVVAPQPQQQASVANSESPVERNEVIQKVVPPAPIKSTQIGLGLGW